MDATRERETLLLVAVACEVANLKARDLKETSLPATYSMTSETFGAVGYGLDETLEKVAKYVGNVQLFASCRSQLALVYAVPGYGKTFFAQALYRKLRRQDNDVLPLLVTFNDHSRIDQTSENDVRTALALRLAFFAFVDHAAYGFIDSSDPSRYARLCRFDAFRNAFYETVASYMDDYGGNLAKDIIRALDIVTDQKKTFALIVDDTAQLDPVAYPSFARCIKDVADCLQPARVGKLGHRGRVASIIVGTTLAAWRRAGFQGWKDDGHTSPRPSSLWLSLPGARLALSDLRSHFVDQVAECLTTMGFPDEDQSRIENLASILRGYANGHWRTCEDTSIGLESVPSDPRLQHRGPGLDRDLDSQILLVALERTTENWKARVKSGNRTWETAFTTLLAASILNEPANPQETLPIPGTRDFQLIADWREDCVDLVPLEDDDRDAHVPEFSLLAVRCYAESLQKRRRTVTTLDEPVTLEFTRHLWGLLGGGDFRNVAVGPNWQRWELDLAHIVRLKFVSLYLWRCYQSGLQWHSSEPSDLWKLPDAATLASDGSNSKIDASLRTFLRGFELVGPLADATLHFSAKVNEALDSDLWRSNKTIVDEWWPVKKANDGSVLKWENAQKIGDRGDIETYSSYDHSAQLSRDWQPGDVLIPGEHNKGFDVMVFVRFAAVDQKPERNGLILFQGQLGSVDSTTTLNEKKLNNTVEKCLRYRGDLFGDSADWMGFPVKEEDVVVVCASHCPCEIDKNNVASLLKQHGAEFSVAFTGLDEEKPLDDGLASFFGKTLAIRVAARPDYPAFSAS